MSRLDCLEMAQFGPGAPLAAQCPQVSVPDGWRAWTDADGPLPPALLARAQAIANDTSVVPGATESFPLPGVTTLLRLEPRDWMRDDQGNLIEGCFRVTGIYLPLPATSSTQAPSASAPEDKVSKTVGVLTVVSLAVGILGSLAAWGTDS
jgi:hypothetical protein